MLPGTKRRSTTWQQSLLLLIFGVMSAIRLASAWATGCGATRVHTKVYMYSALSLASWLSWQVLSASWRPP